MVIRRDLSGVWNKLESEAEGPQGETNFEFTLAFLASFGHDLPTLRETAVVPASVIYDLVVHDLLNLLSSVRKCSSSLGRATAL